MDIWSSRATPPEIAEDIIPQDVAIVIDPGAGPPHEISFVNIDSSRPRHAIMPTATHVDHTAAGIAEKKPLRHIETVNPESGIREQTRETTTLWAGQNDPVRPMDHPMKNVTAQWDRYSENIWAHEHALVDALKEDINRALPFAGLFSVVLAIFVVPFYPNLVPQSPDTATQILMVACAQLSLMSANAGDNLTQPAHCVTVNSSSDSSPSHVPFSAALWLAALVCSLGASLVAISVSQWLHRYMDKDSSSSTEIIRVWGLRRRAFMRWRIETIISILPILLQVSVFLFLVGLAKLLWTYNHVSAKLVAALMVVLLALSISSALIPAFAPGCPYKSPQAWFFIRAVQQCRIVIHWIEKEGAALAWNIYLRITTPRAGVWVLAVHGMLDRLQTSQTVWLKVQNWKDVDDLSMRVQQSREEDNDYSSDKRYCSTLVEMDKVLMDDSFLECFVRPMIMERHLRAAVEAFYAIAQHRAHGRDASSLIWFPAEETNRGVEMMALMSLDLLSRIADDLTKDRETRQHSQTRVFDIVVHLLRAVPNTTLPVHGRLITLLEHGDLHDTAFLQNIADVISTNEDNFEVDIQSTRKLMACVPRLREQANFDNAAFMKISGTALLFSSRLPRPLEEFDTVLIEDVMDAVLQSITAEGPTQNVDWYSFAQFLQSVEEVANFGISLFPDKMVESFERCGESCPPDNVWFPKIKRSMRELMKCEPLCGWSSPTEFSDPRRLIARLEHSDFYDTTFLQRIADVISRDKDKFKVDIQCTSKLLACLPRLLELQDFDDVTFIEISGTALLFSSSLLCTEQVNTVDIKEVMDAVLQSIPAVRRARNVEWRSFAQFLQSVDKVANLNISLFSDEMVESLESFVLACPPADGLSYQIKRSMQELMEYKLRREWSSPTKVADPRYLIARLEHSDLYGATFLLEIADVISTNEDKFKVDIQNICKLLACLPRLREVPEFDKVTFMRISGTALLFSSKLPRTEQVDAVLIARVMDAVLQSIPTMRRARNVEWRSFAQFLQSVDKVANLNISLFPDEMVESLESCALSCPPTNSWSSQIKHSMQELMKYKLRREWSSPRKSSDPRHLIARLEHSDLYGATFLQGIADAISTNEDKFKVDIQSTCRLLAYVPKLRDLASFDNAAFMKISGTALLFCSKLPRTEQVDAVLIARVMDAVLQSIPTVRRARNVEWRSFAQFLQSVDKVANLNISLFPDEMVESLESFVLACPPTNLWFSQIKHSMQELMGYKLRREWSSPRKLSDPRHLIARLEHSDLYGATFLQEIEDIISTNEDKFKVDIQSTRRLLACLPRLRKLTNFDNAAFMKISSTALLFSSNLLRAEPVDTVLITRVMDAVLLSIPAESPTQNVEWRWFAQFLQSVEKAAYSYSLFPDEMFEFLESCALSCPPTNSWSSQIKRSMQELMEYKLRREWSSPTTLSDPRHLIARLEHSDLYGATFLQEIADAISTNEDKFKVDIQSTCRLLAYVPKLRDLASFDNAAFMKISGTALLFCSKLPITEQVDTILIADMMDAVLQSIYAERPAQDFWWCSFAQFLQSVEKAASSNISLFSNEMVESLESFVLACLPTNLWSSRIKRSMQELMEYKLLYEWSEPTELSDSRHLIARLEHSDLYSATFLLEIADVISTYEDKFKVDIQNIRKLLACLRRLREVPDFDKITFMRISGTALLFASNLPRTQQVDIVEIKEVMDAVKESISVGSAGVPFAGTLTRDDAWHWFSYFLEAVVKTETSLYPNDMVDSLGEFASLCPESSGSSSPIAAFMRELRQVYVSSIRADEPNNSITELDALPPYSES